MKLYLWKPRGRNVGHLSLILTDGTYISFWPRKGLSFMGKRSYASNYEQDVQAEGREADKVLVLPRGIADEKRIKKWWIDYVTANKYHLLRNNCAVVVREALRAGDIFGGYEAYILKLCGSVHIGSLLRQLMITPTAVFQWVMFCNDHYCEIHHFTVTVVE